MSHPDLKGDLMLDLGLNYWVGDQDTTSAWKSKSMGIYYTNRKRISDKFSFYPAIGIGIEKYGFQKNFHLVNNDGSVEVSALDGVIKRNQLVVTYFDVPLELRFHPKSTIEGEGFFVGAGVIGGLKLSAHTKIRYTQDGHKRTEKFRSNFGLNDFRYGMQVRFGWKGVSFFFKRYFSETFRHDQQLVDSDLDLIDDQFFNPTTTTIGINFTGF